MSAPEQVTFDKVVATIVKIRTKQRANKKAFETEKRRLDSQKEMLSNWLLEQFNTLGIENVRTASGTAYKFTKVRPQGNDWDAFYEWVSENNAWDALERRIKQKFIATYMAEHDGGLPPGVSVFRQVGTRVTVVSADGKEIDLDDDE